ncbi:hypothetical protein [Sphingomonas sp. Y38-1Y]|uniref:hypothetical protein n=1 Tax=Sphingomonas sp. Y38-1Y TaxID=3078265 RepID=UPI0028EBC75E|nr:hypothetical protein [Sphingomonas sp. Y38-1Y]
MKTALVAATLLLATTGVSRAQDSATETVAENGLQLFIFDRAAWIASDAVMAAGKKAAMPPVAGWVTERGSGDTITVTFFTGEGDTRQAVYAVRLDRNRLVGEDRFDAPRPLTAAQRSLNDAVKTASAEAVRRGWRPCGAQPFNAIALPPAKPGAPTAVYLLTPQTRTDSFPLGGHYRVAVDAAGQVTEARAFTKSCLEMGRPSETADKKLAMLATNHLLDPQPTEIHVFTSLAARLPVAVKTGEKLWVVQGASIRQVPR